jgi:hypothetical protein
MQGVGVSSGKELLLMQTKITELSGKIVVIQSDFVRVLNEEGLKEINEQFEKHGFKVIWLSA